MGKQPEFKISNSPDSSTDNPKIKWQMEDRPQAAPPRRADKLKEAVKAGDTTAIIFTLKTLGRRSGNIETHKIDLTAVDAERQRNNAIIIEAIRRCLPADLAEKAFTEIERQLTLYAGLESPQPHACHTSALKVISGHYSQLSGILLAQAAQVASMTRPETPPAAIGMRCESSG